MDTICALATPPGGALGIIRISGPDALPIVSTLIPSPIPSGGGGGRLHAYIKDAQGEIVDDTLITVFHAPHSYTGEDTIEISCHGSTYILNKTLQLLVDKGCRMANPGEYTMRAYLNGKMDLSQAEAVADLIASTNRATHQLAISQLRGGITTEMTRLRAKLLRLTTLLELELDFSDHDDLQFADRSELQELSEEIHRHIQQLSHTFETGQALKQGIPVAIIGKTNVGKSTLLNRLLKDDRAIVSHIHGTTRDTIEEVIHLHGIPFRFIDTAGIRQTTDQVEQIGIQRTYQTMEKARIILWLVDQKPTDAETEEILKRSQGKSLLLTVNKIDISPLPSEGSGEAVGVGGRLPIPLREIREIRDSIPISAKHGTNISQLEEAIYQAANIPELHETDVIITNARHYEALLRARDALQSVIAGLQTQLSADLIAEDLRQALSALAEITGEGQITPHEVLENIFKHFCVGK